MNAASSLSSSTSSSLTCGRIFRRSRGGAPVRKIGSPPNFRVSGSCASATEREREGFGGSRYYYSKGYVSGGGFAAAAAGSLYELLGVPAAATGDEIKAAYRRLARACHPDVVAADRKGASADEFMKIHAAYTTLSDPDKRAEYDRRMVSPPPRQRSPFSPPFCDRPPPSVSSRSPSSVRFTTRSWETDQCW
ncbi:unnamed protein product [Spirodela intermedia]|uniref:J domain-containing protein n=1 Tax=Spirodela intermedia TaxID=51605 RepID=A0A7I8L1N0_SPIIN|nr:unnamed protein product [Spirodela intermedia]